MDSIQDLIETMARQTPKEPEKAKARTLSEFEPTFQAVGDPKLDAMLDAAKWLVSAFESEERMPRPWLSLLGNSGAGKTTLAMDLIEWVRANFATYQKPVYHNGAVHCTVTADNDILFVDSSDMADRARNGDYAYIERIKKAFFVVIDEMGGPRDPTGFVADLYVAICNKRLGKWTVITSNKFHDQIGADIDQRLASRMLRNGSRVVETTAIDWNER